MRGTKRGGGKDTSRCGNRNVVLIIYDFLWRGQNTTIHHVTCNLYTSYYFVVFVVRVSNRGIGGGWGGIACLPSTTYN